MFKPVSILLLALIILASCSSEQTTTITENQQVKANSHQETDSARSFKEAFGSFFDAVQQSDTAVINRFIHPKYNLWIIEQPGALPKMTQVARIQNFGREYQNRSFFTIAEEMQACKLTEEPLPDFDCADMNYDEGKSGYSKDGCFAWNADKFRKSGYWNYASLSDAEIQRIEQTLPYVQKTVLHTNTSFEFHFGQINGQWYLLFAKLIYPCSA